MARKKKDARDTSAPATARRTKGAIAAPKPAPPTTTTVIRDRNPR